MGEITVISEVALANTTPHASPQPDSPPSAVRELTRSVAAAVQTVNEAGFAGQGREVTFSFDQATRVPVVKVLETSTREVITQWPPEYLLRMAADARKSTRDSG